jgi:peptidoglycan hydrolase-like protein with peptidoglycan-binding domain
MTLNDAHVLTSFNFQNTDDLVFACKQTGLPLWVGVAFVEAETRGANIYGNDGQGTFSGRGPVTQANYLKFYTAVITNHGRSNGVGPMQITWPGFHVDAMKRKLDLWHPLDNYAYGFRLVKGYLNSNYSNASIRRAGTLYNGSASYGLKVGIQAAYWHGKLVPAVTPATSILRIGTTVNIKRLQIELNHILPAYSHLKLDGIFGFDTERVIVEFQTRCGLQADGVIGPATREALISVGVTL